MKDLKLWQNLTWQRWLHLWAMKVRINLRVMSGPYKTRWCSCPMNSIKCRRLWLTVASLEDHHHTVRTKVKKNNNNNKKMFKMSMNKWFNLYKMLLKSHPHKWINSIREAIVRTHSLKLISSLQQLLLKICKYKFNSNCCQLTEFKSCLIIHHQYSMRHNQVMPSLKQTYKFQLHSSHMKCPPSLPPTCQYRVQQVNKVQSQIKH